MERAYDCRKRTYGDDAGLNPVYDTANFADGKVALIGNSGIRILVSADYQIAMPLILNKYFSNPVLDDFSNPASGCLTRTPAASSTAISIMNTTSTTETLTVGAQFHEAMSGTTASSYKSAGG